MQVLAGGGSVSMTLCKLHAWLCLSIKPLALCHVQPSYEAVSATEARALLAQQTCFVSPTKIIQ
jgi:hypothetical protein